MKKLGKRVMKLLSVVGARPQFVKIAPLIMALKTEAKGIRHVTVNSGQHYDYLMTKIFFDQLKIPDFDYHLNVGSASHAVQTASLLKGIEPVLKKEAPDAVIVYGDTNTTLAAAIAAVKLNLPVIHIEAGLRSFDLTMPEEINRVLVDRIATLLFTPSKDAGENLIREGRENKSVHFVGNIMIDTLIRLLPIAKKSRLKDKFGLSEFILVTLHRPSNVDDLKKLKNVIQAIRLLAKVLPVVFPVHPRTKKMLTSGSIFPSPAKGVHMIQPLGYLDFLGLEADASLVITDSGGVQEETTYLGVPCLTVRPNTERPVTISLGTNKLVGNGCAEIFKAASSFLGQSSTSSHSVPPLWDGQTAQRIVQILKKRVF